MEEFTFPSIPQTLTPTHQLPFPTPSSSLWLLASPPLPQTASPSFRRSFSSTAIRSSLRPPSPALSDCGRPPLDGEERMDMLWEDFNDELRAHRRSVRFARDERRSLTLREQRPQPPPPPPQLRQRKKPSLEVMLRALKKLFVVQGAHNTTTTTTASSSSSSPSKFQKEKKFLKQQK